MKVNTENIPQELIDCDQWVCWVGIKKDNGKTTKIPRDPKNGSPAKTNGSSTWGSFDEAINHCNSNNLAGIGFVFTKDDFFAGIDLDDCLDPNTGKIDPWAEEILNRFNSYTEITPSGRGLHILLQGELPGSGRKKGKLEMYDRGRFFTVTGNQLQGYSSEIMQRNDELIGLYNEMSDPSPPDDFLPPSGAGLDLASILRKAFSASNGEKFRQLWQGNCQEYHSQSEADLALCKMLSYWIGNKPYGIDLIFRESGLYRPKWDDRKYGNGMTYGEATIQKALSQSWPISEHSTIDTNKSDDPFNLTDLGNAERLASIFGDDIQYCHAWHEWLIWDGCRWSHDKTNQIINKAKRTVRSIYEEANRATDSGLRSDIAKHAQKSEGEARIKAMINLARSEPEITVCPEDLDQDHWLLTCRNVTLDLKTGNPMPHRRDHLITQLAPVEYDPYAKCPTWDIFLDQVMDGNENLISFLQRAIGYSLTGDTSEQCFFIFYGAGANGKSTFLQTINSLLGDYAMQATSETLLVKKKGALSNDVARLKGARLVTASEAEEDQRLAEGLMKQMTGQDKLSARFLYQENFEFKSTHKIFLATNHKPTIKGIDPAMWRRIKLIPFDVTIPEYKRDKKLLSKLEAELPGILAWAVRGCVDWLENGLGIPVEVRTATDQYKNDMDIMAQFLSDCCDIQDKEIVPSKNLYTAYLSWCEEVGEEPLKQRNFGLKLKEKGFKNDRNRDGRCWKGLNLLPVTHLASVTHGDTRNHNNYIYKLTTTENICDLASHVSHASPVSQISCVDDLDQLI